MPRAIVELKLYDDEDEPIKTLRRVIVPWGILKKALRLNKHISKATAETMSEEDLDEITKLIVEIFGEEKVSVDELEKYADVGDMISTLNMIAQRAQGLIPNGPPAAK